MHNEFLKGFFNATNPAERALKLLEQIACNSYRASGRTEAKADIIFLSTTEMKKGFRKSLDDLKLLTAHIQFGGEKPSGAQYNMASEVLFGEARDSGNLDLAAQAAIDILTVDLMDKLQDWFSLGGFYAGELESAAKARASSQGGSTKIPDQVLTETKTEQAQIQTGPATVALISADEIEAGRATTA